MSNLRLGHPALRWAVTILLIVLGVLVVDEQSIIDHLGHITWQVISLVLVVTVIQVVVSAWRWRYTAGRLGLRLGMGSAISEYYLATFINQVLPGGVLGDAARAWRHGQSSAALQKAANAVVIERFSGQLMLAILLLGAWLVHPPFPVMSASRLFSDGGGSAGSIRIFVAVALAVFLLAMVVLLAPKLVTIWRHFRRDLVQSLLQWPALVFQIISSLLVVMTYLAVFLILADALNFLNPPAPSLLIPLVLLLLLTMAIPLTVAGWGIREGAAALLWPLAGLPAEEGVTLGIAYGLVFLISSLPGALVLLRKPLNKSVGDSEAP